MKSGSTSLAKKAVTVDLVYDTVCPWCYVGKRRLEEALASRPNVAATIRWTPFLLNPGIPPEGMPYDLYLSRRFGSVERARKVNLSAEQAGQSAEIDFDFDHIGTAPNSVNSHRLVLYADRQGKAQAVVEALFYAYFVNGKNIGDLDLLIAIGEGLGFESATLRAFLMSDELVGEVFASNRRVHGIGVSSVPTFIVNDINMLSGGHPPEVIARLFDFA